MYITEEQKLNESGVHITLANSNLDKDVNNIVDNSDRIDELSSMLGIYQPPITNDRHKLDNIIYKVRQYKEEYKTLKSKYRILMSIAVAYCITEILYGIFFDL